MVTRIGLIILASDPTIEREWRAMVPAGIDFLVTRIPYDNCCTRDNLVAMSTYIEDSAHLILPGQTLDAIAYGCTSASVAIGPDEVTRCVNRARPAVGVATPITAALKALGALRLHRIAVLAPYVQDTSDAVITCFTEHGIDVLNSRVLGLASDYEIAAVDEQTIIDCCADLDSPDIEAIFMSCTGLTASHLISTLEEKHQKPVLTSNQCLLWQSLRIAGSPTNQVSGYGCLFDY